MINREHDLPITKQALVLRISRGSVYYPTCPMPEADLAIMRRLDQLHLEFPFAGSRMLQGLLVAEGCKIGRRHVKTLMQRMGIEALYRRQRTTKPSRHKIYRYLLRGEASPTEPGFGDGPHLYPDGARLRLSGRCAGLVQPSCAVVAAIDHDGGGVCVEAVEDALLATASLKSSIRSGQPVHRRGIHWRADQKGIAISMDGRRRRDNVFVERLWRASNTRRCICEATTVSVRLALQWANTSVFTTVGGPTRPPRRDAIYLTSPRCHSAYSLTAAYVHSSTRKNCSEPESLSECPTSTITMKSFLALNLQVAEASVAEMHDMPIVAAAKAIGSRQAINFSFDVCIGLAGPPLSCRVWTSADAVNHSTKLRRRWFGAPTVVLREYRRSSSLITVRRFTAQCLPPLRNK